jgi:acyl-CoA synthetase (AMP-forming)/AMP-acid ligase II
MALIREKLPDINLTSAYGLTETSGSISTSSWSGINSAFFNSGAVVPTAQIQIRSAKGESIAVGERGHVWIRGHMLMDGYVGPENAVFGLEAGWFNTGDIGLLTDQRELVILDRGDDLDPTENSFIQALEIERLVLQRKGISDAAVVNYDSTFVVAVVPEAGFEISLSDLRTMILSQLGRQHTQVECHIFDKLPRTATGKILKREIVDQAHSCNISASAALQ